MDSTRHGDNIRDQIINEDAYGQTGELNAQDVAAIIDAMHTNIMDANSGKNTPLMITLGKFLDAMLAEYDVTL